VGVGSPRDAEPGSNASGSGTPRRRAESPAYSRPARLVANMFDRGSGTRGRVHRLPGSTGPSGAARCTWKPKAVLLCCATANDRLREVTRDFGLQSG